MAKEQHSSGGAFIETVKTIVYALLIAGIFRTVFYQPFYIPSGSMKDTLLVGDFIFVNKMAYGYSYASCPTVQIPAIRLNVTAESLCGWSRGGNDRLFGRMPERGDVVVFRAHERETGPGRDLIKRAVGLPGDTVQMINGILHINGEAAPQVPDGIFEETKEAQGPQGAAPRCANEPVGNGAICRKDRLIETLPGGTSHAILNIGRSALDDTPPFIVPDGHLFMMGDNRDASGDSRIQSGRGIGMVPFEDVVGRASVVLFSSSGRSLLAFWTWRADRFFKGIQP